MLQKILSSLSRAPTSDFVYSSLSFFGRKRGGVLPGRWFVDALEPLGVGEPTVRQTLYRMERSGALETSKAGRIKLYGPTPATRAVMDAGRARILETPAERWDGEWTVAHFSFAAGEWRERDRLREVLMVEGFGALDAGLYLHPRDRVARVTAAATEMGRIDNVFVFRGRRHPAGTERRLVHQLWDLAALRGRYLAYLNAFDAIEPRRLDDLEAFGVRFASTFEFFRISWDDPDLPAELLPDGWPAARARRCARRLYRLLDGPATRYADGVLRRVSDATPPAAAAPRRAAASPRRR